MAIVPPPLSQNDEELEPLDVLPVMSRWVRGTLVGIALALTALFTVAVCLNPYRHDGSARRMETHMQLGLPECTFKHVTGLPCPSCGMTTSFALTMRGDLLDAAAGQFRRRFAGADPFGRDPVVPRQRLQSADALCSVGRTCA